MDNLRYLFGAKGPSGFSSKSTAEDVAAANTERIRDKVFIVTGANAGIGKETCRALYKHGAAKVIMACRNLEKAKAAETEILGNSEDSKKVLQPMVLDISSLSSVTSFVSEFKALKLPLNVLINNAGVMACPFRVTENGFESQLGTNHFGHFLLTESLLPVLKETEHSRVVIVASGAHQMLLPKLDVMWDKDQMVDEKKYDKSKSYGRSKLANVLHARELNERLNALDSKNTLLVNAIHPGVFASELWRHMTVLGPFFNTVGRPFQKSIPQGAATSMYAAVGADITTGGNYLSDSNIDEKSASDLSRSTEEWKKLRELSFNWTKAPREFYA